MDERETFRKNLKEKREEKGLTQAALAKKCYLSTPTVCFYENGRSVPDIIVACKMAEIFECTLDELVGRDCHERKAFSQ